MTLTQAVSNIGVATGESLINLRKFVPPYLYAPPETFELTSSAVIAGLLEAGDGWSFLSSFSLVPGTLQGTVPWPSQVSLIPLQPLTFSLGPNIWISLIVYRCVFLRCPGTPFPDALRQRPTGSDRMAAVQEELRNFNFEIRKAGPG
jgi:DNA-binding transcriptional LysR family regulator